MSLPNPFNTVDDLLVFTSFKQGANNGLDSVREGTFAYSQFQAVLRQSRNEIYRKTLRKQNDEFDEDRREELRECELWLSAARLYPRYGERIALKTVDANAAGASTLSIGADTPPPSGPGSKGEFWTNFMYKRIRAIGLELLRGRAWDIQSFAFADLEGSFPFESNSGERI